jgi:hypothetical protein
MLPYISPAIVRNSHPEWRSHMKTKSSIVGRVALAVAASLAVVALAPSAANALPPRCSDDCPERPDPPGGPTGPTYPDPQPPPPPPFAHSSQFGYGDFALYADAGVRAQLMVPPTAGETPWPLPQAPFTPEVPDAPVRVTQVEDNLWAFTSFDGGGRAADCLGTCSDSPQLLLNSNYGMYQATLQMRPRLDVEFWKVVPRTYPQTGLQPSRVTEVTATLEMRAFAECADWQTPTGSLNAKMGVGNVTIKRDTGVLENIVNFFIPGFTSSQNANIRAKLMESIGVGSFANIPFAHGSPCHTLGVTGSASDGAIVWNQERCLNEATTGCRPSGGTNSQ